VRLRGLRSDPLAFDSTFEGAAARPEGDWVAMALGIASNDDRVTFFVVDNECIAGYTLRHDNRLR
jgi:hypothetical protein